MADREAGENTPGGVTAREPAGGATMINQRILSQGGGAMTLAVLIISLVMLVSLLGCASQIVQISQPVAEKTQEEQPKKPAMPTITYRPGM